MRSQSLWEGKTLPILTRWLCRPASVAVHWCLTPGTTRIEKFPQTQKECVYIYILGSVHPFLWVFWGWRWNFQPKTLELQERHPRNMMDKFSLIGLGCFKIFKGSTLWMRSRGLTLRPLFEWVVNSTTSKNGDFGCSLAGFKYPVPTCYTPTSSPLPLDSSQQKKDLEKRVKKSPARNLKGTNPPQIPSPFFSNLTLNRS